jgi:hypothetical protein
MSKQEKEHLLDNLLEAHLAVRAVLDRVDLEMPVYYEEGGWRVRDIIGHIATWDKEVAKSLRAYKTGSEYLIPDLDEDEVDFNETAALEQRKLSAQQIVDDFIQAYKVFRDGIQDIPADRFPGDLLYPWGDERGSITLLVDYMIEHAIEHLDEIKNATKER